MHVHFKQVKQWKCGGQKQAEREKNIYLYRQEEESKTDIKSNH